MLGIYRIYYSGDHGELYCQKVTEIEKNTCDSEITTDEHISRGLTSMIKKLGQSAKTMKLPLNKKQKNKLFTEIR